MLSSVISLALSDTKIKIKQILSQMNRQDFVLVYWWNNSLGMFGEHIKSLFITPLRLVSWIFPLFLPTPCVGYKYSVFQVKLGINQHKLIWRRLTKFHKPQGQVQFEVIFKNFGRRWTCFNILTFLSQIIKHFHSFSV